jgi:hypothetical protein
MKLSAYIVRHDSGFSPNPFGRVCTLACCKPVIRRNAEKGDIIIGTGSARCGQSGQLIYAMRVEAVLPLEEYWKRYPSKRPAQETPVKARGDNVWHRDASGNWCCAPGALHDERNRNRDLKGRNALISPEFYYFGRDAIKIPDRYRCLIATTQGHKNTEDTCQVTRFWEWIAAKAPKPGRIGIPFYFTEPVCGVCECNRKADRGAGPDCGGS